MSLARMIAIFHAIIGFFAGLLIATINVFNILAQVNFNDSALLIIFFNIGAGVALGTIMFFFFIVWGWLIGYIGAVIYNFAAGRFGGIKIEID